MNISNNNNNISLVANAEHDETALRNAWEEYNDSVQKYLDRMVSCILSDLVP